MADTLTRPSERSPGDAARTDRVDMSALAGEQALVVIRHLEDKQEIATVNGVSDAVSVDLLVVDGQYAGTFEEDRLIFNIGVRNVLWGASDSQVFAGRLIWKDTKTGLRLSSRRRLRWDVPGWTSTRRSLRRKPEWMPRWTVQANVYGAGLVAAGECVEEVAIVLIPRDGDIDDALALTRPYEQSVADAAIDRLERLAEVDPSGLPACTEHFCDYCPREAATI